MAIKIKHGAINFKTDVTLTPFEGEPEAAAVTYRFFPASKAREMAEGKSVQQFLAEIIEDINGLEDPYSPEVLAELLDWHPAMGVELMTGFWQVLAGARAKN